MYKRVWLFLPLLMLLASCSTSQEVVVKRQAYAALIDLSESVQIIRAALCKNKLGELLEEHDQVQLDALVNNFSPAQMAFEAEVLSTTIPLVCIYYFKDSLEERDFLQKMDALAQEYSDKVKFVIVDAEKLFSLAQAAGIEQLPTLAFLKDRDIFEQMRQGITLDAIKEKIAQVQ